MTADDYPIWSYWYREYSPDHWVLFVVEERLGATPGTTLSCRILATSLPSSAQVDTHAPGHRFTLGPSFNSIFCERCRRLA